MSASESKDTVYIDVDEEITGIIDKVKSSDKKIVALVLPKRATVLQSIVNMKLLKRTADRNKKNLVLITSEAGLLPLAGATGIHVAKNLQSKPEIPDGPPSDDLDSLVHEEEIKHDDSDVDKAKSVGELAGAGAAVGLAAVATAKAKADADEAPIDVASEAAGAADKSAKKAKTPKDKSKKVPNFERFRKQIIIGAAAAAGLLVLIYLMFWVWPKATIVIDADASSVPTNVTFTADTTTKTLNLSTKTVPASTKTSTKTGTQSASATGSKDIGTKATGTVTVKNCDGDAVTLPGGTIFTGNGLNYVSNQSLTVPKATLSHGVIVCGTSSSVGVTAAAAGTNYNAAPTTYTTSQLSGNFTINGSAMSGGTSNVVKVVSQGDVDAAKAQLTTITDPNAKAALEAQLKEAKLFPIPDSFTTTGPNYTNTPNVGDQASTVTVTGTTTYTMLGVDQDGLEKVINAAAVPNIDPKKQAILASGYSKASYTTTPHAGGQPTVAVQSNVIVGPKLDLEAIKKQVAGMKSAETISTISALPGIKSVSVKYSPFYVSTTPKDPKKVTIVFKQASTK